MKQFKLFVALFVCAIMMTSCVSAYYAGYSYNLNEVQHPETACEENANLITTTIPEGNTFEDDYMIITLSSDNHFIDFDIQNKSEFELTLLWDEMSIVDINDYTDMIVAGKTRMGNLGINQVPIVIPSGKKYKSCITMHGNVEYDSSRLPKYDPWVIKPVVTNQFNSEENRKAAIQYVTGKTVNVHFPVLINGLRQEYNFQFVLEGYDL